MFASGGELPDCPDRSDLPNLILMDIGLNGRLDGIGTARMVRQRYAITLFFSTAYSDGRRIAEARVVSPHGYIVKPFIEQQFIEVIRASLNHMGTNNPAE